MESEVQKLEVYEEDDTGCFVEDVYDADLKSRIIHIAETDDKPKFVSVMKQEVAAVRDNTSEPLYCPPGIFDWICTEGAVACATAMLAGDTELNVDLNLPDQDGAYPLHYACTALAYDMIYLFLSHGARTDVKTLHSGLMEADLLPLNVALETLSYHRYLGEWTPKQSIYKLIITLCLPAMRVPLECGRLLAWNTKQVDKIFDHYAMEGKLIEMAALLLVAREKVMAPDMFQDKDSSGFDRITMIRRIILEEIELLTEEETKFICYGKNRNSVRRLKDKKAAMTIALALLEVFQRAGDAIETYRQAVRSEIPKENVVRDIKTLLEEAGFVLKDKDIDLSNIDCESKDIKLATEVLEKRTSFSSQLQNLRMPFQPPLGSFREEKKKITDITNERSWPIWSFLPRGLPALCPHRRQFHTLWSSDVDYFPKYRISERPTWRSCFAMKRSAAYFLSLKKFSSFALAIKKGITHI